jgi:hypothetical protein
MSLIPQTFFLDSARSGDAKAIGELLHHELIVVPSDSYNLAMPKHRHPR